MNTVSTFFLNKLRDAFITPEELMLWGKAMALMDEHELTALVAVVDRDADAPRMLTDNLLAKRAAVRANDRDEWNRLLAAEKKYLQSLVPTIQEDMSFTPSLEGSSDFALDERQHRPKHPAATEVNKAFLATEILKTFGALALATTEIEARQDEACERERKKGQPELTTGERFRRGLQLMPELLSRTAEYYTKWGSLADIAADTAHELGVGKARRTLESTTDPDERRQLEEEIAATEQVQQQVRARRERHYSIADRVQQWQKRFHLAAG